MILRRRMGAGAFTCVQSENSHVLAREEARSQSGNSCEVFKAKAPFMYINCKRIECSLCAELTVRTLPVKRLFH